ncbi:MAG: SMP-30/gluconolactonase/LRE family protein [Armatimonadota bacterium]|nr:SMP-30/gluconolactonase/LRE family protein [Armatimonadota bacterium]
MACSIGGVPALSDLVDLSATPEKVATGFQFTEGPLWLKKGGLIFSDIPADKIFKWSPGADAAVFRDPSGNSNGLTRDAKGRIVACEHGNRRVSRTEAGGKVVTIADRYQGHRLNSPNDAVVKSDGSIYFTDPPYGVDAKDRELDFQGVYRLSASGDLTLLAKDMDRPNGLAFSPDEKVLYVADSSKKRLIMAFDVKADGTLTNGRLFAELKSDKPGSPDGMKVDKKGNIYSTGPGGIWIFTPCGVHVGTVEIPEMTSNCGWGDADCKSLYVTAQKSVYRIRCRVGGSGF